MLFMCVYFRIQCFTVIAKIMKIIMIELTVMMENSGIREEPETGFSDAGKTRFSALPRGSHESWNFSL